MKIITLKRRSSSASDRAFPVFSEKGMVLVLTLMVLVLITAMVTEFAYGVYTGTNSLHNWYDSQRLSLIAASGISMASAFISETTSREDYTYPGFFEMDFDNLSEKSDAIVNLRIEDENSKFNINMIVSPNGRLDTGMYNSFKRMLSGLSLDPNIADYIADWIDPDKEERIRDSEKSAKNNYLYSTDELLLIRGINKSAYDILLPYVTIYGDGRVNINGAERPVLMSLSQDITEELAQRVMDYRKASPFEDITQLQKVAGFGLGVYGPVSHRITVKGQYFNIRSVASSSGIRRMIEAVVGENRDAKYWRES